MLTKSTPVVIAAHSPNYCVCSLVPGLQEGLEEMRMVGW